jgi:hypothetical protein
MHPFAFGEGVRRRGQDVYALLLPVWVLQSGSEPSSVGRLLMPYVAFVSPRLGLIIFDTAG